MVAQNFVNENSESHLPVASDRRDNGKINPSPAMMSLEQDIRNTILLGRDYDEIHPILMSRYHIFFSLYKIDKFEYLTISRKKFLVAFTWNSPPFNIVVSHLFISFIFNDIEKLERIDSYYDYTGP